MRARRIKGAKIGDLVVRGLAASRQAGYRVEGTPCAVSSAVRMDCPGQPNILGDLVESLPVFAAPDDLVDISNW